MICFIISPRQWLRIAIAPLLNRLTAGHTETQVVVAVRRVVGGAERRPTVARVVPPAAAANHAGRALDLPPLNSTTFRERIWWFDAARPGITLNSSSGKRLRKCHWPDYPFYWVGCPASRVHSDAATRYQELVHAPSILNWRWPRISRQS